MNMLIKLYCKALTWSRVSINSSICFDFILRWEKYLLPEVINSLMHFLMKQGTPTSCSFLVSLPRVKIFCNREWLSSGRKTYWEEKVCASETWISVNPLKNGTNLNSVLYREAGVSDVQVCSFSCPARCSWERTRLQNSDRLEAGS